MTKTGNGMNLIGDIRTRKGAYANAVFVTSQEREDILDFIFTDGVDADGNVTGILASRVMMNRSTLLQLRDAITAHLDKISGE